MQERNKLFWEIMKEFQKAGVLGDIILAGSWCLLFYKKYFDGHPLVPEVRTMDLDIMVKNPPRIKNKVDLGKLLEEKGFESNYHYSNGLVKYMNPHLEVEFLIPDKGQGKHDAYKVPGLGVMAQGLRFLDLIESHTMQLELNGIEVVIPRPEVFALHKFLYNKRRVNEMKKAKDLETSIALFRVMLEEEEHTARIKEIFDSLPKKWKSAIRETSERAFPELLDVIGK